MQFHFHANQSHIHKNGFALRLALKKRHKGTRKWPIGIDFDDFTSPFKLQFLFRLRRYIKHSRQCFMANQTPRISSNFVVFSTLFSVFGYPDETLFLMFDILHHFTLRAAQVLKDIKLWSFFAQYVLFYYNEIKTNCALACRRFLSMCTK